MILYMFQVRGKVKHDATTKLIQRWKVACMDLYDMKVADKLGGCFLMSHSTPW